MKYFGTDGIRGVVGEKLTADLAKKVGFAYGLALRDEIASWGKEMDKGDSFVLLGRDTRSSGQMLLRAISAGLISAGFNVVDAGIITTPAHNYATKTGQFVGGVMITASHNPAEHNGIKLCDNQGKKHSLEFLAKVEQYIDNADIDKIAGNWDFGTISADSTIGEKWISFILKSLGNPDLTGLTVALDLANGAGYSLIPEGFRLAGAKVVAFNTESDGKNINNGCGSVYVEKFVTKVLECGADVGFSFDGDADRIMAIDKTGKVVDGTDLMYIFGVYYAQHNKLSNDAVVTTPITNLGLEYSLNKKDILLKRTREVGGQYVQRLMEQEGYVIGGEENGHMLLNDIGEGSDGMCVGLYLLKIMREEQCDLGDLLTDLIRTKTAQANLKVTEEQKAKVAGGELTAYIKGKEDSLNGGRIIVRPSGTECVVRVLVEGDNQLLLDKVCDELSDSILKL